MVMVEVIAPEVITWLAPGFWIWMYLPALHKSTKPATLGGIEVCVKTKIPP
jgi:hypothetical protein